ncbi:MAG: 2-hydroxychromene-2-carboxylate isomerase [Rhizobacter sp.]
MKPVDAQFLFDFGSPNAYLAHEVLPAVEARTGVVFERVPVLLGGLFKLSGNRSPVETYANVANRRAYDELEIQRFVTRHGLTRFRSNPHWPVNTLHIMRGAVAARKLGCFAPYVQAVFAAMWERSLDMGDTEVVVRTLDEAGLDGRALHAATQDPQVKAQLLADTQSAFERGAFGSPTFFVGAEIFFGKDRLRDVEEEIVRQKHAAGAGN